MTGSPSINRILIVSCVSLVSSSLHALEKSSKPPFRGHETFDVLKPEHFTKFPEKNSRVREGVLWTHGKSGNKYPPSVGIPIAEKDCTLSFKYRHLGDGGMIWFFINGEDGFGSFDHLLRVKLTRAGVAVQVDGHSKDANHPKRQADRKPDKVSGAYRLPEKLPLDKVNLTENKWHQVKLVFIKNKVTISLDDNLWTKQLSRPGFVYEKQELYWMLNGGDQGIEIDDVKVVAN
ncbi:MAG: hypothetical protein COA78_18360 [Blastopirellula sp.]|nr:MAG: hypothetical protein COA78_18360 [Blastopirellula sp.]